MKLLIVNSAEAQIREFIEPLIKIAEKAEVDYHAVEYKSLTKIQPLGYDGVIISGSPQGDDIFESHQTFFEWLKEYQKPVLGICAGHHIIGYMHGAEIFRSKEIEKGEIDIEIIKDTPLFNGYKERFVGIAMHNDSISVPAGFSLIASTKKCVNEAMKKNDRPWFTLQFHPEIQNEKIIQNFIEFTAKFNKQNEA